MRLAGGQRLGKLAGGLRESRLARSLAGTLCGRLQFGADLVAVLCVPHFGYLAQFEPEMNPLLCRMETLDPAGCCRVRMRVAPVVVVVVVVVAN